MAGNKITETTSRAENKPGQSVKEAVSTGEQSVKRAPVLRRKRRNPATGAKKRTSSVTRKRRSSGRPKSSGTGKSTTVRRKLPVSSGSTDKPSPEGKKVLTRTSAKSRSETVTPSTGIKTRKRRNQKSQLTPRSKKSVSGDENVRLPEKSEPVLTKREDAEAKKAKIEQRLKELKAKVLKLEKKIKKAKKKKDKKKNIKALKEKLAKASKKLKKGKKKAKKIRNK
jgi:hypothetical protein